MNFLMDDHPSTNAQYLFINEMPVIQNKLNRFENNAWTENKFRTQLNRNYSTQQKLHSGHCGSISRTD